MAPPAASGRTAGERFKQSSRNFTNLSRTDSLTNLADMTSVAASCGLQNAIKYFTKVRKTGVAGTEVPNSVTVLGKITSNDTLNLTERLPRL